jgi:outer membrane protein assembly factor BamB
LAEACDQISYFAGATGKRVWFYSTNCTGGGGTTPGVYGTWIWVRDWAVANVIVDAHGNAHGNFVTKVMPAFFDANVVYTSGDGLSAVDIASAKQVWSFMDAQHPLCSSPVVAGKGRQIFVASQDGTVFELSADTGKVLSSDIAGDSIKCGTEGATLAIAKNHVFVPTHSQLVAY